MPSAAAATSNSVTSRRLNMPPIKKVKSVGQPLTKPRNDRKMQGAFGLGDDQEHWSRMKADAVKICLEEFPPNCLAESVKQKLALEKGQIKRLQFRGAQAMVKEYVWKIALQQWRKKFDYDVQYFQKRYPHESVKDIICNLIVRWNGEAGENKTRKFAEGRDLERLFCDLGQQAAKKRNTIDQSPHQQEPRPSHESRVQPLATNVNSTTKPSSVSSFNQEYLPLRKPRSETTRGNANFDWAHVLLDITHLDQTKPKPKHLAFTFICGSNSCAPGNIQMELIKKALRTQNLSADDFSLRLKGSQEELSWELSDLCVALTLWCRNRSHNELNVPLQLVPRDDRDTDVEMHQDESILSRRTQHLEPVERAISWHSESEFTQSIKSESRAPSPLQHDNFTIVESSISDQLRRPNKRGGDQDEETEPNLGCDQPSYPTSDSRPNKRARRIKQETE